jgi:hypothetical protein
LYEWVKVHNEFSDAKKRGEAKSLLYWERLGRAACDPRLWEKNPQFRNFNTTSWIYTMKCRFNKFGWNPVSADPYDAGDDFEFK